MRLDVATMIEDNYKVWVVTRLYKMNHKQEEKTKLKQ